MNIFTIFRYELYILQLENYELRRYLNTIKHLHGVPRSPQRKNIKWTKKLTAVVIMSFVLEFVVVAFLLGLAMDYLFVLWVLIPALIAGVMLLTFFFPFLLFLGSVIVLGPIDIVMKKRRISAAMTKMHENKRTKVIVVAGSYGKTTAKEIIAALLEVKFKVVKTKENTNTLLGVAETILKDLTPGTECFVVEMGEHYPGDVRTLCELAPPDMVLIMGINESHLERFGIVETLIKSNFEAADFAKPGAEIFVNIDDRIIYEHFEAHGKGRKLTPFGLTRQDIAPYRARNKNFHEDGSGWSFDLYEKDTLLGHFHTPFLGEYIMRTLLGAVLIARRLGLSTKEIEQGVSTFRPVAHRLQPIYGHNAIFVIDDSYNGNPEGVREAIATLARFKKRRKIYITPGLVETGNVMEEIHREIGRQLTEVADIVILIKNTVTPFIAEGLVEGKFDPEHILWFPSGPAAHAALRDILRPHDVILFQNDWTDNYQ